MSDFARRFEFTLFASQVSQLLTVFNALLHRLHFAHIYPSMHQRWFVQGHQKVRRLVEASLPKALGTRKVEKRVLVFLVNGVHNRAGVTSVGREAKMGQFSSAEAGLKKKCSGTYIGGFSYCALTIKVSRDGHSRGYPSSHS